MTLNLDAYNVTAQVRRMAAHLERAPHLYLELSWVVPPTIGRDRRLAAEFQHNPARLEDHLMGQLRMVTHKNNKIGLIQHWLDMGAIDIDQAVFMANTCEIDPQGLVR